MKFKYCPECGSIQLQSSEEGLKCKKCRYSGAMKEDSIDVINEIARKMKPSSSFSGSSYSKMSSSTEEIIQKKNDLGLNSIEEKPFSPKSIEEKKSFYSNQEGKKIFSPKPTEEKKSFYAPKPNESVFSSNFSNNQNFSGRTQATGLIRKSDVPLKERLKKINNDDIEII